MADDRESSLRKLHAFTGLVPLGLYLGFHAWELWPVHQGRGPALARMEATRAPWVEVLLVFVPLMIHGALGFKLRRSPVAASAYVSPAFRQFQALTGGLTAAFLVWHVGWVWLPRVVSGRPAEAYAALLDQVGKLPGAAVYVVALTAVCAHFGQGLAAAWIELSPDVSPRSARVVGGVLAVALWLVFVEELAVYATGAGLM